MTGRDNLCGPVPALDDVDLGRLLRALETGTAVRQVAKAFGLHSRTVYRYRGAKLQQVLVGDHVMTFLVYPDDRLPVLVTQRRHPRVVVDMDALAVVA